MTIFSDRTPNDTVRLQKIDNIMEMQSFDFREKEESPPDDPFNVKIKL